MELSIASHKGKVEPIIDQRKDKVFGSKIDKPTKKPAKESMVISTPPVKISTRDKKKEVKKTYEVKQVEPTQNYERRRRTLKEWEEKTYPFPDSDVAGMLEDLLEKKVIELPECKRPEEMHRVNDPKYCKYHRLVSHPVEKCFVLKDLIMNLAKQGRIQLDVEDEVEVNCTSIVFGSFEAIPLPSSPMRQPFELSLVACEKVKFEAVESVKQVSLAQSDVLKDESVIDDEGWTLVTRRKARKNLSLHPQITQLENERREKSLRHHERSGRKELVRELSAPKPVLPRRLPKSLAKRFVKTEQKRAAHMTTSYDVDLEIPTKGETSTVNIRPESEKDEVLKQLECLPLYFSMYDLLRLPKETRCAMVQVLMNSTKYSAKIKEERELKPKECITCAVCCDAIHFGDED
jgi:hypothetical protein